MQLKVCVCLTSAASQWRAAHCSGLHRYSCNNTSKLQKKLKDVSHISPAACVVTLSFQLPFTMNVCKTLTVCVLEAPPVASTLYIRLNGSSVHMCVCLHVGVWLWHLTLWPVVEWAPQKSPLSQSPPPPHCTTMVCVTTPREANKLTHTHSTHTCGHTSSLCVLQDRGGDGVKPHV